MPYEAVIGLEVHVQLLTETKMFCRCPNRFGAEPNTLVCPVCLGYPGTLPVTNRAAVDLALKLASALGCEIRELSLFARKNYFYPDLPKGYQITQYDRPLAEGGSLPLAHRDRRVPIARLHLEEDAGKLLHEVPGGARLPGESLVDFNRAGVPLVEIVSEPSMGSPEEAQDYLQSLRQTLLYTETSDASMEQGSLRCDANVSVRRRGESRLGTKTEIKNLNSFRHVARALEHEIARQRQVLDRGGRVRQETRGFEAATGTTRPLRTKEQAHDYRYFPEPDLPPLEVSAQRITGLAAELPELPWNRRRRWAEVYGLSPDELHTLTQTRPLADYFEAAVNAYPANPKGLAHWVKTEVLREIREHRTGLAGAIVPEKLAHLVHLVDSGRISHGAAREVQSEIWSTAEPVEEAIDRLGLSLVSDRSRIAGWIDEVLGSNADQAAQYRAGKTRVLGFLIGQVMKRSAGRAEPGLVRQLLEQALGREPVTQRADDPATPRSPS